MGKELVENYQGEPDVCGINGLERSITGEGKLFFKSPISYVYAYK